MDEQVDIDAAGVTTALERICALESRLRQAIQATHPLSSSFDKDFVAADREREALLVVRCKFSKPRDRSRLETVFGQAPGLGVETVLMSSQGAARASGRQAARIQVS